MALPSFIESRWWIGMKGVMEIKVDGSEKFLKQCFLINGKWKISTTILIWGRFKIDPMIKAIRVEEEFLQGFFSPVNSSHSIITPSFFHYYLQIPPILWTREWRNRVFSPRSKNKYWLVLLLDIAWLLLILLPPQYLFHFQAHLPLTFWITLLDAFYQSLVCFFVPYYVSPCSLKGFVVNQWYFFVLCHQYQHIEWVY